MAGHRQVIGRSVASVVVDARTPLVLTGEPKGVVAAGHDQTAKAAADVLCDGGSAVDAAIAALAMACVCEPVLCSPGGGGFAMLRQAGHDPTLIDFFPHTPQQRNSSIHGGLSEIVADFGTATQIFHVGAATSATPGFFSGLRAIHDHGATIPLTELIAPAVTAARNGLVITEFQHYLSTVVEPILTADPRISALFAPDGHLVAAGEVFRNPGLANSLEILATEEYADSAVGAATVAKQTPHGHLTADDLTDYRTVERSPLTVLVGDSTIHMNPLPSASGAMIRYALSHLESSDPADIANALHRADLARRGANGDLALLNPENIRQKGTTHISVIDAQGTACSVTTSNGTGNAQLIDGFGFMLNNILGEEDVNPSGAHDWPINTRLSSGMCPTLIESPDGSITALGSGGSNRIRSAVFQVLVRLCLDGLDIESAVTSPRLHIEDTHLDFEDLFGSDIRQRLIAQFPDHRAWPEANMFYGGVHTASLSPAGRFTGVGDARRGGAAIIVY